MSEFSDHAGKMALGSRMRVLSERLLADAEQLYGLYEVGLRAKWFPVFYVLSRGEPRSITSLAGEIGHSHPSVSTTVREMVAAGVAREEKDPDDRRRNLITLTAKGLQLVEKVKPQYLDVNAAVESALRQTRHDLWIALDEFEYLIDQKSLLERVMVEKKKRESALVEIVPYEAKHRKAFRDLNEAWISKYFKMEEADYKALEQPEKILDDGGYIAVAVLEGEPVGVCALMKMDDPDYQFELAKMAVSPKAQGKGVGTLLGQAIVDKARELGCTRLYLESNTVLTPAIRLYEKLGFVKVAGRPTPYERCNIQMELML